MGYFARPYLGIRWQPITPRIESAYRLPVQGGVYVTEVMPDSPALQSGPKRKREDIITRIGDIALDDDRSYINSLFRYEPGDSTTLEIIRRTNILKIQAKFGETKSQPAC